MKLRHAFLIALGVALPLWIRQEKFEQGMNAEVERFVGAMVTAFEENVKATEGLLREALGGEH